LLPTTTVAFMFSAWQCGCSDCQGCSASFS